MLAPYRVLDLSDQRGMLCGQILTDLGADVIQIEPPGGSSARRCGPFLGDVRGAERSFFWWAYARGKRSLVLDLDRDEERELLRELVRTADFLIESDAPGAMARRGLGYEALAQENPQLIYVAITPFGQDGPKAGWAASDLTLMAAGGPLILYGDDDRPPVRMSLPQAFHHAANEAAVAALLALHERTRSGCGQHVDAAAQHAVTACTQADILSARVGEEPLTRVAGGVRAGPLVLQLVFPAKDGHVSITHVFGSTIGPPTRRLMEYVHEQGFCDEATRDKDWIAYTELLMRGEEPIEEFERVKREIAACTASKTKAELLAAAIERKLLIAPVCTVRDLVESEQLAAREYFQEIRHEPEGISVRYPGAFARFGSQSLHLGVSAPRLDQHGAAIRAELRSNPPGPRVAAVPQQRELPLSGVKILDFMWALAGPGATRILADYGATVVRVESTTRLDVCRTLRPFVGSDPQPENSAIFHTTNAGKKMLTLDLATEEGREIARDLARWADVITESFTPRVLREFGLDYESLREINPGLIMLSTCLMGQSGPLSQFAGYGNLAGAIAGFYELTGWPDRGPAGPFGAYTDYISPRYNAIAVLAALEYRRRTGRGGDIDLSQLEASLHFLTPALLDYTANGRVPSRIGNRDAEFAPHGVYAAAGDDRWVALAVETDAQWRALCDAIAQPSLADDPRYADGAARVSRASELDSILEEFTRKRDMFEIEALLQSHGVPASAVQNSPELVRDPQLVHRGHFVELEHLDGGTTSVEGSRFRLSHTPARVEGRAPTFGSENDYVLRELLGYDDERIAELIIAGALG